MAPLPLRRATLIDADKARVVTRSAYAKWVPLIAREPKPMTADYERAIIDHIIDLYEENGQLLALIEVVPLADHLLIESIAVRPDQQGFGLGDKLLQHAEDRARALRLTETRLYTNAAFASNLAFYAKRGYIEYMRETVAPGAVAVHMRKRISID
ncbi:GNAT family N-acetyltransferase [Bradyrhizobium sp. Leo121]|uniref:GNAT family N-acetyltransferase n=1 Tax=Bradyrhizobium sp. Leo121 TaxID=1571195 RepID=UPI001028DF58|nr:GNAT family N-acetyltransferase [Bradyrhizobium sp. Leo121]RZN33920.1 GNAT family N-acetyltransferase [Bradyrhizobium sp. Leo121]